MRVMWKCAECRDDRETEWSITFDRYLCQRCLARLFRSPQESRRD